MTDGTTTWTVVGMKKVGSDVLHTLGGDERLAGGVRIERALDDATAIAKVDEDETAVVAALGHPSGERDRGARISGGKRTRDVRANRVSCVEHEVRPLLAERSCDIGGRRCERYALLFFGCHVTKRDLACDEFIRADDEHEARPETVRLLEL